MHFAAGGANDLLPASNVLAKRVAARVLSENPPIPREHFSALSRLSDVRHNDDRRNKRLKSEAEMNGWCLRQNLDQDAAQAAERSASLSPLYPQRC